jgi:hypothetical protein
MVLVGINERGRVGRHRGHPRALVVPNFPDILRFQVLFIFAASVLLMVQPPW